VNSTVYSCLDSGASCPNSNNLGLVQAAVNSDVTYCFKVSNTGNTYLSGVELLNVNLNYTLKTNDILAPGDSKFYSVDRKLTATINNTVQITAVPTDNFGNKVASAAPLVAFSASGVQVQTTLIKRKLGTTVEVPSDILSRRLQATVPDEACMQDAWFDAGNNQNLVCTAKEVYLEEILTASPMQCVAGSTISKVSMTASVHFNTARYDAGWFVSLGTSIALSSPVAIEYIY
jgi:hypothetical protein